MLNLLIVKVDVDYGTHVESQKNQVTCLWLTVVLLSLALLGVQYCSTQPRLWDIANWLVDNALLLRRISVDLQMPELETFFCKEHVV